jgi:Cytochrome bd terminal oxidase subunit I
MTSGDVAATARPRPPLGAQRETPSCYGMPCRALDLAHFQFAFTVVFYFLFSSFTIGLASYLAVLEGLWLWTGCSVYLDVFRYWDTAGRCQLVAVGHSEASISALRSGSSIERARLHKNFGEPTAPGLNVPRCVWPKR